MCGIAGYIGQNQTDGRRFIERASRKMAHRGPDDEGIFEERGIVLGHRRLSIVDLTSAGHQPMTSADGRWTLVYNGEIYNHEALRANLANRWEFRSRCDAETLLAALALEGPAALERMIGMWGLMLWDGKHRRLLVSRDRYGQKPLYWRRLADGSLRFASEIAPLFEDGERPEMYAPAVAEFLAVGNYGHLGERTFFRDIRAFPPAHWAWAASGSPALEPRRYWRFPALAEKDKRPFDNVAKRQFRDVFMEAVRSQLMADVPIAATLSGGLDSSAVVGAMAATSAGPIKVFTAQAEGTAYDETRYVKAVVQKWGDRLELESLKVERIQLSTLAEEVIRTQEEPFGDPSIIAHSLIMQSVRKAKISVVLGGQGGDELLLGYPYMSRALIASALRRGDKAWALSELSKLSQGSRTALRTLLSAISPAVELSLRMRSRAGSYSWLAPRLKAAAAVGIPELAALGNLAEFWLESLEKVALPHLLHYDDRNSMHYSIEGRMPFLDHRLADIVTGIDPRAFLVNGQRKNLLREACADLVPEAVLARHDKIGFYTPLSRLLCEEAAWVKETVCGEAARSIGLFNVEWMNRQCDALVGDPGLSDCANYIWRALAVTIWVRVFRIHCDRDFLTSKSSHMRSSTKVHA
jgi:asparagine synthase (glutamine-hydrolysing)